MNTGRRGLMKTPTTTTTMKRLETSMNTDERPKDYDEEAGDKYLDVEIIMNMCTNDVDEWLNVHGDCTENPSTNSLFDTREFEIEFTDGTGNRFLYLQEATDHKRDNSAVPRSEGTGHGANGQAKPKVNWKCIAQTQGQQSLKSRQESGPSQCS
jgi:hypothetical protein